MNCCSLVSLALLCVVTGCKKHREEVADSVGSEHRETTAGCNNGNETSEFERMALELSHMEQGGLIYDLISDDKNRRLRNRHHELRMLAVDHLLKGMPSGTAVADHWCLMYRWYEIMQNEEKRLNFSQRILEIDKEIEFAERQVAIGRMMGLYTDEEMFSALSEVAVRLCGKVKSIAEIKKAYGIK